MISIDYAQMHDVPRYEQVLRAAFDAYVGQLGRTQAADAYAWLPDAVVEKRVVCAHTGGSLVGVAIFKDKGATREIEQIAVSPAQQGQGIGSALINWIELDGKRRGIEELALDTAEMMTDLIRLYQRHGFFIARKGPARHKLDDHPRVYMFKTIADDETD